MSISITCTLSGDLDNPKHRKAAEDIHNAIRNAIASQDGIGHMPERLSMNETKTTSQFKGFDEAGENEFMQSGGKSHQIVISTGFHLNP